MKAQPGNAIVVSLLFRELGQPERKPKTRASHYVFFLVTFMKTMGEPAVGDWRRIGNYNTTVCFCYEDNEQSLVASGEVNTGDEKNRLNPSSRLTYSSSSRKLSGSFSRIEVLGRPIKPVQ